MKNLLPVGSVVRLKDGISEIIILGRAGLFKKEENDEDKIYITDYVGGLFPIGLDVSNTFYFNTEDIEDVIFEGFRNDLEDKYVKGLIELIDKNK